MKEFFKKVKWDSIIISTLTIVLGILCVVMPNRIADVLCIVFGCSLIAMSIALFVRYFAFDIILGQHILISAVVMCISGVFCLIYPNSLQNILTVLFGIFIVVDSISTIEDSIYCAKANIKGWLVLMILSMLTLVLGIAVMFSTFDTVMIFAGCSLIIEGVKRLVLTLVYSHKIKTAKKQILNNNEIIIDEE